MTFFICGTYFKTCQCYFIVRTMEVSGHQNFLVANRIKKFDRVKKTIQVCTDIRVSKCVNDKFVIFEWTIPLSTKWNNLSNCAILSVPLVPIQLWGETGYLVHLVGLFIKMSSTRGSKTHCGLNLFVSISLGMSQQRCPYPTAQAP